MGIGQSVCTICWHTPIKSGDVVCPLCARMSTKERTIMRDISSNHPSVWFAEFSMLFIDGALKTRLLEIASVVRQMHWSDLKGDIEHD